MTALLQKIYQLAEKTAAQTVKSDNSAVNAAAATIFRKLANDGDAVAYANAITKALAGIPAASQEIIVDAARKLAGIVDERDAEEPAE